jgi:hypothetical protein
MTSYSNQWLAKFLSASELRLAGTGKKMRSDSWHFLPISINRPIPCLLDLRCYGTLPRASDQSFFCKLPADSRNRRAANCKCNLFAADKNRGHVESSPPIGGLERLTVFKLAVSRMETPKGAKPPAPHTPNLSS